MSELEKLTIRINGEYINFIITDYLNMHPLELVSVDSSKYALYITEENDIEYWFLIENVPEAILQDYLDYKATIGDIFQSGKINVVKFSDDYEKFIYTDIKPESFKFPDFTLTLKDSLY